MQRLQFFVRFMCNHCICSLIERARKTVRGSAEDIGWLQRATDMPPVEDGTRRFREILESIRLVNPSSSIGIAELTLYIVSKLL